MPNEPMTSAQLDEIRKYLDYPSVQFDEVMLMLNRLVPPLLAEVERLRAREAAAMAIVREVANTPRRYTDGTHDWALVSVDFVEQASALTADEGN